MQTTAEWPFLFSAQLIEHNPLTIHVLIPINWIQRNDHSCYLVSLLNKTPETFLVFSPEFRIQAHNHYCVQHNILNTTPVTVLVFILNSSHWPFMFTIKYDDRFMSISISRFISVHIIKYTSHTDKHPTKHIHSTPKAHN